jgi:hypothetical protein
VIDAAAAIDEAPDVERLIEAVRAATTVATTHAPDDTTRRMP